MKKMIFASFIMAFLFTFFVASPVRVQAYVHPDCKNTVLGLPTWYEYLDVAKDSSGGGCSVVGPPGNSANPEVDWAQASGYIAIAIVEILIRLSSLVAVGFVIYGGFRFITSQGEPDGIKTARETILNAVIGLVIAVVAAGLVNFLARTLT